MLLNCFAVGTPRSSKAAVDRLLLIAVKRSGLILFAAASTSTSAQAQALQRAAAKAGVEGLVRSAAATYARRGIRVNAVAPGLVRTPLSASITGNEDALEASREMHALGRIGEPEGVADAIVSPGPGARMDERRDRSGGRRSRAPAPSAASSR